MTTKLIPSNAVQKIPTFEINGRVILQPNTWYTCPAGKKAIVKGSVVCTGTGAGAEARFAVAGTIKYRWIPDPGSQTAGMTLPRNISVLVNALGNTTFPWINTEQEFNVELAAGETIVTSQDSGTNAEFNLFASVQETPA